MGDSDTYSQSFLGDNGRRKKLISGKQGGNGGMPLKGNHQLSGKPLIITSPLNKSKQDMFSQTGKLNAQLEADMMLDESS